VFNGFRPFGAARQRVSGLSINPATLPLTLWLDARDYVAATHPAQPTWISRTSTGNSGTKSYFRRIDTQGGTNVAATANPTISSLNSQVAVGFTNSGGRIRLTSTPTGLVAQSSTLSITESFFSFVGSFNTQASSAPHNLLAVFGPSSGYGISLQQNGSFITSTLYDGAYKTTPSIDNSKRSNFQVIVQGRIRPTSNILELRIGKGPWNQIAITQTSINLTDELLIGASQGTGDWVGNIQELMIGQYAPTDAVLDELVDRANLVWGAPKTISIPEDLPLSLWLDARDFVGATYPAQPTWNSRASAGPSNNRRLYRRPASLRNPVATTVGSAPAVFFDGTGGYGTSDFTDNSWSYIVNTAAPTTPLRTGDLYNSVPGIGYSFSIVLSHPAGLNSGINSAALNYLNPQIFGPDYTSNGGGYSPYFIATSGGYQLAYTGNNSSDYYMGTRPETSVTANTHCLIQGRVELITNTSANLYLRLGKGPWTVINITDAMSGSQYIIRTLPDFTIAGFFYQPVYGKVATPKISELMIITSRSTDEQFDKLADRAIAEFGLPEYILENRSTASSHLIAQDYSITQPDRLASRGGAGIASFDATYRRDLHNAFIGSGGNTVNPGTVNVNGKTWLTTVGTSAGVLTNVAGSTAKKGSDVFGTATSPWSLTIACSWSTLAGGITNPRDAYGVYGAGYGAYVTAISDGSVGIVALNAAGTSYQFASLPPGTVTVNERMIIQVQFNGTQIRLRKRSAAGGTGAWTALTTFEFHSGTANLLMSLMDKPFNGPTFAGEFGGVFVEKQYATDMDYVLNLFATSVGLV